jgi:glyoxylase-like metal-dependent hydrolase (beta-lactamase superfamily II)
MPTTKWESLADGVARDTLLRTGRTGFSKLHSTISPMPDRHPANAPGSWYVDTHCIDCGASRTLGQGAIVEQDGQSVFGRQPGTEAERLLAWRARLLCPTASIRTESHEDPPRVLFPEPLAPDIYRLGYNARSSFGAHSFGARRAAGNLMVDAPRWTRQVVTVFEEWGGLSDILLSHRDDVADAGKYAQHFGSRVWIHEADRDAAPYATSILTGRNAFPIAPDILAIPVPGHTEGSTVYLVNQRYLFTGDSLAWSFERNDLTAFHDACWYSWEEQTRSLRALLDYGFEWVLAGHGASNGSTATDMRARLERLVTWMGTR